MKYKLIFFSLILNIVVFGQNLAQGESYFTKKQYSKARPIYETMLKHKPNDALINFRFARCCYELKDYESAIAHFLLAGKKYPDRNLFLGDSYFKTYRFEESLLAYQTFLSGLKPDDSEILDVQKKVVKAEKAAKFMSKIEDIAIVDSLVVNKSDFLRFYKFSSELGKLSQELLKFNARQTIDKIKYTTQRGDRVYYSDSIQGQMDIFTSYKLLDAWSDTVSISNVLNTSANENYPFLLLDGITLYFASDGENSMGGYDIFITRYTPATDSFLTPENIGFPFNSPANDYMMVIDEQRKLGWFATDRYQPAGKVRIYTFVPNDTKTIIRTENNDSLRSLAQLKIYRKLTKSLPETTSTNIIPLKETDKQIEFVINDSLVYNHLSQFKSEEAIKLWAELETISTELKTTKAKLSKLRVDYSNSITEEVRTSLSIKIIELENKNVELENKKSIKKLQVRNAENQYFRKL
ncbi:MAG: tetratricopeptide repeat protein [Paludibacter sp.]